MSTNGKMTKWLSALGMIAAWITFASVSMAYPTVNAELGVVALPHAYTADSGSFVDTDRLFTAGYMIKTPGQLEMGITHSFGVVDGVNDSTNYRFTDGPVRIKFAGGGSLTLAANLKGTVKIRYAIRF